MSYVTMVNALLTCSIPSSDLLGKGEGLCSMCVYGCVVEQSDGMVILYVLAMLCDKLGQL